jgi:hypothetical protein
MSLKASKVGLGAASPLHSDRKTAQTITNAD